MKPKRILIVEDERLTIELLKLQLQEEGFDIIIACDGEEGLKKAREENPDLIILDLMLPKLDGLEVCKIIKNGDLTRNIPVVMLTCRTDMDIKLEGFQKGADDYIVKPFDQRELTARINSILRLINLQKSLKESREEIDRIAVINEINKAISSSLNLEEILKTIGRQLKRLIDYDLISIGLIDKNEKFIRVKSLIPRKEIELDREFYLPIENSLLNRFKNKNESYIIDLSRNKIAEILSPSKGKKLLSAIVIPFNFRNTIIGTLSIASYKSNSFTETDLEVAKQIAPQVAIAMENARLYEKVSESEKNYQQLFDNALDLILLTEPDTGLITGANKKVFKSLNYSKDELFRMKLEDIISHKSSLSGKELLQVIRNEKELIFETLYRKKDGRLLNVEVSAKLIEFNGKKLVQNFARDITVRKKAEKDLKFLANITTNSPLAIIGTDKNDLITSWNKGGEMIFGYKAEEIIGKSYHLLVPDELKHNKNQLLQEALIKGLLEEIETEKITKNGKRIPVKVTYTVIKDEDDDNAGIAYIIRDIEKERELHRQLVQSEKLSTMGQLVSGVAHELNNPLTGVIGFSELLIMEAEGNLKNDLKRIHSEANRAKRIVQNLLSFARMHKPEKKKIDLNSIIHNVIELKSYEMKVDNIDIKCDLDQTLPITLGDSHQLQQVFLNIINNAHQAMVFCNRGGCLKIKTYRKESTLFIEFRDNGPGIANENMIKVFDPFFTTKEVGKGTGLGLSLSYGIIKDHGGYIQVWSKEGEGATFTIELPLIIDNGIVKKTKTVDSVYYPCIKDCDILVIDDEETVLELLKGILTREGNNVETVRDGKTALEKISSRGFFDVIMCDIKMPRMSGSQFFNLIKEKNPVLTKNFIFMSGAITNNLEQLEFFDHKENPFLEKPFSVSDVLKAVDKVVNRKNNDIYYSECENSKIMTSI